MNRISKVFLACACSVFCMNGQAQSNATWTNDFSNAGETLKVVNMQYCRQCIPFERRLCRIRSSRMEKLLLFFQSPCP